MILFVHGLGGTPEGTWGNFASYIQSDAQLSGYEVEFFTYPTGLLYVSLRRPFPRVQTLAQALATLIENRLADSPSIVLVAHSLGGLIARQYLVDEVMQEKPLRVDKLLLYAVPNNGAGLAEVAHHISRRHHQLRQLCRNSDFIIDLNNAWEKLGMGSRVGMRYVVAGQDTVVSQASAQAMYGTHHRVDVLADRDHRTIVKPLSPDDLTFQVLKNFVLEARVEENAPKPARDELKVIAFDLDGTLLRGLKFSWTRVWEHLKYPKKVYMDGMGRYLRNEWSYDEWCKWAVSMFRARNCSRTTLEDLAEGLRVTTQLHDAIRTLKESGFTTALISGGIDVFLYKKIPDADELFDHIFINRLTFDDTGLVESVESTAYDFDGKAEALEKVAKEAGYSMKQTVFVGEGFNDSAVSRRAGMSIAYPPHDMGQMATSHLQIREDNLMAVAEAVLGGGR